MRIYSSIKIILIIFFLYSCQFDKEITEYSLVNEISYLEDAVTPLKNAISWETDDDEYLFIRFSDGECQLCAVYILEIQNLYDDHFKQKNVLPILVIFGEVDDYVERIINKEKFTYPIYNLNYDDYLYFITKEDKMNTFENSVILNSKNNLMYRGDPLKNTEDLNRLSQKLKKL